MTAEIAILNKSAIALASDSAITVGVGNEKKIYPSANKLFMLSKYHPIGIMIYGSATFMSIDWETIIKLYRKKLKNKKFSVIKEYSKDFLNFIENEKKLFPSSQQDTFFSFSVILYFKEIQNTILKKLKIKIEQLKEIDEKELISTAFHIIKSYNNKIIKVPYVSKLKKGKSWKKIIEELKNKYSKDILKAKSYVFEKFPLTDKSVILLKNIAINIFVKHIMAPFRCGIVIAGYGDKEIFPCLESFLLESIINNRLKYVTDKSVQINFNTTASINPFAQSEMVFSFMEGIDPYYQGFMENKLVEIFTSYSSNILEVIKNNFKQNELNKNKVEKKFKQINFDIIKKFVQILANYRRESYIDPIINIVSTLPKSELAAMAESLVNLTSFKRKISSDAETVGGPIDVAVISKGDGFIWIKRKHYFKPELNYNFFQNYFMENNNEKQIKQDKI